MAVKVLRDVYIEVDGTDLSNRFTRVEVDDAANGVDATSFGSKYSKEVKGLRNASITGTVQQDTALASVDATLAPLNEGEDTFEVIVVGNADSLADISATNPGYRMSEAQLMGYKPLSGGVGELSTTDVTFSNAGDDGVERLVAPPA